MVKGYKLPVIRWISSRDLMCNMVIIKNNCIIYLKVTEGVDL